MLGSPDRHQLNSRKDGSRNPKKTTESLVVEEVQLHPVYISCSFIQAFSLLLLAERLAASSGRLFSPHATVSLFLGNHTINPPTLTHTQSTLFAKRI